MKDLSDKHKDIIGQMGEDHTRKVDELNDAHGKSSSAKDKIIEDLISHP